MADSPVQKRCADRGMQYLCALEFLKQIGGTRHDDRLTPLQAHDHSWDCPRTVGGSGIRATEIVPWLWAVVQFKCLVVDSSARSQMAAKVFQAAHGTDCRVAMCADREILQVRFGSIHTSPH